MEWAIEPQKSKHFKVKAETGTSFIAIADLIGVNRDDLLEKVMAEFVSSVRNSIGEVAEKYPAFSEKYPFVEHPKP